MDGRWKGNGESGTGGGLGGRTGGGRVGGWEQCYLYFLKSVSA